MYTFCIQKAAPSAEATFSIFSKNSLKQSPPPLRQTFSAARFGEIFTSVLKIWIISLRSKVSLNHFYVFRGVEPFHHFVLFWKI